MIPEEGEIVHYVAYAQVGLPSKKHFSGKLGKIRPVGKSFYADVTLCEKGKLIRIPDVPMAASREVFTWHQIGGYGCQ